MNDNKETSPLASLGYILLLLASIILLVIGLAPIGLLLIVRSMGVDLTFVMHWNGMAFIIFGLIVIGIVAIPKYPRGTKIGVWVVCFLAIMNMGGCLSLSGLRNISEIKGENKSELSTASRAIAKFSDNLNHSTHSKDRPRYLPESFTFSKNCFLDQGDLRDGYHPSLTPCYFAQWPGF